MLTISRVFTVSCTSSGTSRSAPSGSLGTTSMSLLSLSYQKTLTSAARWRKSADAQAVRVGHSSGALPDWLVLYFLGRL